MLDQDGMPAAVQSQGKLGSDGTDPRRHGPEVSVRA